MASCDFSRNRKLSFARLIYILLSFTRCGIQIELNRFISFLIPDTDALKSITKSAFSQARQKIDPQSLRQLNTCLLNHFDTTAPYKHYWHGLCPVAIDGTTLNLPNHKSLEEYFGVSKNQNEKVSIGARGSVAYDICNRLVLDAVIAPLKEGEVGLSRKHLSSLNAAIHLLLFDRGYPSINFAIELSKQGFKFCFRLSTAWKEAYQLLKDNDDVIWHLPKGRRYKEYGVEYRLKEGISFRLIKIVLSTGETEVLLTNLEAGFSIEQINALYAMRWQIEECYKRLKQVAQIEFFSGKTVSAIEQDFHARMLMLNIATLIETQELQPSIDHYQKQNRKRPHKRKQQVNRTVVYAALKNDFYNLVLKDTELTLKKVLDLLRNSKDIVRPGRSFKRKNGFKYKRKPLLYKAA